MSATKKPQARGIFEQPMARALDATISANRVASNHTGINPYDVRNQVLLEEEKDRICEENGEPAPVRRPRGFYVRYDAKGTTRTDKDYTEAQLEEDGDRDANHRRTLDRNLRKAGHTRLAKVCAHHIVARGHPDAFVSRMMLYAWGIGINDADNGVFLPASASDKPQPLASAVGHDDVHRNAIYYIRVERRLGGADQTSQAAGRATLRKMRAEMLSGAFPLN